MHFVALELISANLPGNHGFPPLRRPPFPRGLFNGKALRFSSLLLYLENINQHQDRIINSFTTASGWKSNWLLMALVHGPKAVFLPTRPQSCLKLFFLSICEARTRIDRRALPDHSAACHSKGFFSFLAAYGEVLRACVLPILESRSDQNFFH